MRGEGEEWATARGLESGITLAEVTISLALAAITIASLISSYVLSGRNADWSAKSAAAQALASQRLEQTQAAKWDTQAEPVVDELVAANFPLQVAELDLPSPGGAPFWATNTTTISNISTDPPIRMISVNCTWSFQGRALYTNSIVTYRSPDQ